MVVVDSGRSEFCSNQFLCQVVCLRQGLGTWFISWPLCLRIFLSDVVFRFGVELTFRKVSYGVALFSLFCWKSLPLF